ncbi:O-methyltransferase [Paenibacillus sp. HN-1]|uniref:O-methyltransferase n=1 Tax=Paenibacillus TaxID=44249 RepID=UPI001CA92E4B|nr:MULTISPECIES: O-methyltransferase [Paenibacillus]MBY9081128.1 O-methyltransferase [Paenibacillus sp. CGMCC 1.18879]MBY9087165.1 O-methyltransferase [Paenibacillus sinensis]
MEKELTAKWNAVDEYFNSRLLADDPLLDAVLEANTKAGLPPIDVAPNQGKLLYLLAKLMGASSILEIGTLGGYSSIWLARALPPQGRLVTLEYEGLHAEVAAVNLQLAGLADQVDIRVGAALDSLAALKQEGAGPFDLIFIDADKPNNPHYLKWAMELGRPGTLIVADNVVRDGEVLNEESGDERVQGIRRFADMLATEPRLEATALQTVGAKGYDGFVMAVLKE